MLMVWAAPWLIVGACLFEDEKQGGHPLRICIWSSQRPRQVMSEAVRAAHMSDMCMHRMDDNMTTLQDVLGACQRILQTPIPLSYTRHTRCVCKMQVNVVKHLSSSHQSIPHPVAAAAAHRPMGLLFLDFCAHQRLHRISHAGD